MPQDRLGKSVVAKSRGASYGAGMRGSPLDETGKRAPLAGNRQTTPPSAPHQRVITAISHVNMFDYRGLLHAVFGPYLWNAKAAQILGISPRMVRSIASNDRALTRRHWEIMVAYAAKREE